MGRHRILPTCFADKKGLRGGGARRGCQGPWRPRIGHHTAGRREGSAKELSAPPGQPIVHLWARVQLVPEVGAKCGT